MENSYEVLPDSYTEIYKIDIKNNKNHFLILNIGSLVLLIPFLVLLFFFDYYTSFTDIQFAPALFLSSIAMLLTLAMHELIHGIFFKIFGKGKLKFGFHGFALSCTMKGRYFSKRAYIIIGLAPFVILNIVLTALSILFYRHLWFLPLYISLAINFSGSIGDLFVCYRLLRLPKTTLVADGGLDITFYNKDVS